MNADPENFDALLKLLALKRHEQPPPGYFNRLPGQIIVRLQASEDPSGFWARVLSSLTMRPAFAYSLGLAFCGAFATGIIYVFQMQPPQTASISTPRQAWELAVPSTDLASQHSLVPPLHVAGFTGFDSTNDQVLPSLFINSELQTAPVNYSH